MTHTEINEKLARLEGWIRVNNPVPGVMDEYVLLWEHPAYKAKYEDFPPYATSYQLMGELIAKLNIALEPIGDGTWESKPFGKKFDSDIDWLDGDTPQEAVALAAIALLEDKE